MNRYNIFYQIHKGLRAMLYNTASLLQQTDFYNEEECNIILNQVGEVLDLFDEHAHTEDNFVLSAIEAHEPSVAVLFEEEHIQDHELSNHLRTLLNILHNSEYGEAAILAGGAVRYAFIEFMIFNLQHMAKEETKLNNLLWKHFSDEQLQAITKNILSHVPQNAMAKYSTWMMRGLSNNEIISWMKEIKTSAPEFVFSNMLLLAEKELPAARWNTVQESITEGALLA